MILRITNLALFTSHGDDELAGAYVQQVHGGGLKMTSRDTGRLDL
jgi:hypothetical protein